jgi:hypothetical protein
MDHLPIGCSQLPLVGIRHLVNGILQSVEPRHNGDILAGVVLVPQRTLVHVVHVVPLESKDPAPVLYATQLACTVVNTIIACELGFQSVQQEINFKILCMVTVKKTFREEVFISLVVFDIFINNNKT